MLKNNGNLPNSAQESIPNESAMDAAIAHAFHADGYVSTVNFAVILHALEGMPDTWDLQTRMLADHLLNTWNIRSEDTIEIRKAGGQEIDAETAIAIIRDAITDAWQMPRGSLDAWEAVAQLAHSGAEKQELVFWRVFLTRPDAELNADTFAHIDNFNYRVSLDGTVLNAATMEGWRDPKEDYERWNQK